jgi:hypothetical protein
VLLGSGDGIVVEVVDNKTSPPSGEGDVELSKEVSN